MAWIRKLAHFMIRDITIRNGDEILDSHQSDWLESFHEVTKMDGSEYGYNKMIGKIKKIGSDLLFHGITHANVHDVIALLEENEVDVNCSNING